MRAWLFVPGHESRKLQKALASDADVVVIDWEDAVPEAQKELARTTTRQALETFTADARLVLRINPSRSGLLEPELAVVSQLRVAGLMLPKVEDPAEIALVAERGLPIIPMIESALGVERALEIAGAHPLIERLAFGSLDFVADIGAQWSLEGEALHYPRSRLVMASRAAGLSGPIDGVYPRLRDPEGLRHEAMLARRLGFAGKTLIHPEQIAVVKKVFSPTSEEVEQARAIIKAFEAALAEKRAATTVGSRFIDPPVVRWAEQILRLAGVSP